jgi:hypothetical protein
MAEQKNFNRSTQNCPGGGGVRGGGHYVITSLYRKLEWMAASHVGERRILRINIHIEGKGRSSSVSVITLHTPYLIIVFLCGYGGSEL